MQPIKSKLVKHYKLNPGVAQHLINAALVTPKLIRAATDEELLALPGMKQSDLDDIREKVG